MKNLEIEYKVMINKNDFIKLEKILENNKCDYYVQTNHYFDSEKKQLKKNGYSLRIRHIENLNRFILTLKIPKNYAKMEYEYEVKSIRLNNVPNVINNLLNTINVKADDLINIGQLKTIRKEYKIQDSLLCLDHNFYNDKEDYEIECEATCMEKAEFIVTNLLNKYNISFAKSTLSKVGRATK